MNYIFVLFIGIISPCSPQFCEISRSPEENPDTCRENQYLPSKRYLLYDVNPAEGFNLRRDVYIRVAVLMHQLNRAYHQSYEWNLVLPPWDHLYHWRSRDIDEQSQLPWGLFFDLSSLRKFIPVIELYEFFRDYSSQNGRIILDQVFVLQNDLEMFKTGDFRDKNEIIECEEGRIKFRKKSHDEITGNFWGYKNITARNLQCVLFHGTMHNLIQNLEPKLYQSFFFDHMEIPLHNQYGSRDFWKARRSMRYNSELYKIAKEFRSTFLNSTDAKDKTERAEDWQREENQRNALGGPYLGLHFRRRDFLVGRSDSVPSIKNAALQVIKKMNAMGLNVIFIATDTHDNEFYELKRSLGNYTVIRYLPPHDVKTKFKDGGVAIIDQIICSHARHFIGTRESTFTFRIQEEREIMGFPEKSTFNILCRNDDECLPDSQWKITW